MTEVKERRYSQWAGNPKGDAENLKNCIYRVTSQGDWYSHQCTRRRWCGKDGLYCKLHSKMRDIFYKSEEDI